MGFQTNLRYYDFVYGLQSLQLVLLVALLAAFGYLLFGRKQMTNAIKIGLWFLAASYIIIALCIYSLSAYKYWTGTRPALQQQSTR